MKRKKLIKRILWTLAILFLLMNVSAAFHAYKFTHFINKNVEKTKDPKKLSTIGKIKALLFGIDNPRPTNKKVPNYTYQTITLQSNKKIECWYIKTTDSSRGTVVIFHGFSGEKSSMLDKSDEFNHLGYNTLVVDFMGSGGSEGNQTTVGYREAEEVKTCYDYIINTGEKNVILFGTSMGAVAILKAINDYNIQPSSIIIECPFGSLYQTTCARFKSMGVPSFPMAGLLDFWGGIENGFWAFSFKPTKYAKSVKCPTLLLYGEQDENVSRKEIDDIFANLKCEKSLKTYPLAGHENYLTKYKDQWISDIKKFLDKRH